MKFIPGQQWRFRGMTGWETGMMRAGAGMKAGGSDVVGVGMRGQSGNGGPWARE